MLVAVSTNPHDMASLLCLRGGACAATKSADRDPLELDQKLLEELAAALRDLHLNARVLLCRQARFKDGLE